MKTTRTPKLKKVKTFEPKLVDMRRYSKTNNITYVIRRLRQYDPESKSNLILLSKHVGYYDKDTNEKIYYEGYEPLPDSELFKYEYDEELRITSVTSVASQTGEATPQVQPKENRKGVEVNYRTKVTTVPTLYHHVFESLTNATPLGSAICKAFSKDQKNVVSALVEFNLLNDSSLNEIETFQLFKTFTYKYNLTKNVAYETLKQIGSSTSNQQQIVFEELAKSVTEDSYIVIDSTAITSYSKHNLLARKGRNYMNGHEEYKIQMIYSVEQGIPIAFRHQEGNIPDVSSLSYMIRMCKAMGINNFKCLLDQGYGSQDNFAECLELGIGFTSPVKLDKSWVKKQFL